MLYYKNNDAWVEKADVREDAAFGLRGLHVRPRMYAERDYDDEYS